MLGLGFLRVLFSRTGLLIMLYLIVGVFVNTAPPHIPGTSTDVSVLHSWAQYFVSVMLWPLSFWKPTFTVGQWKP